MLREAPESEGALFARLVVSARPPQRTRAAMVLSGTAHVAVLLALILVPLFVTPPLPPTTDYIRVLLYDPPPPPPAPLPRGTALAPRPTRPKPATPVESPRPATLVVPEQLPVKEAVLEPEARLPESRQWGSPSGSDSGVPEGMEGGVEEGVVGGVPGGVPGGVVGGTGDIPFVERDYDRPPRILRQPRPVYPQEAFVNKVEGIVLVEILIDAEGRVVRARVLRSVRLLDEAALDAVRQWAFAPAIKRGRPVATLAQAPITFRIF